MSLRTLPLLFVNLGGEMMYILDQRLKAQNIPADKAKKVLHDIVSTMFNKRFMEELFKPQELYSKKAMRTVFDKLAHASIMRLNSASMDKLYDLMTMAVKYQMSICLRPFDILLVTLNHMDTIRTYVDSAGPIRQQVEHVYKLLAESYGNLSGGELQFVRHTLLWFFQDMHIRVSVFLKDKVQNSNGKFTLPTSGAVPFGTEVPGTIRVFNADGDLVKTTSFECGGNYTISPREGSVELRGDRIIKLGTNMYSMTRTMDTAFPGAGGDASSHLSDLDQHKPDPIAKAELTLLARLMGTMKTEQKISSSKEFRLNLFNDDAEEEKAEIERPPSLKTQVIKIDASKKEDRQELQKLMQELNVEGDAGADLDLLELMDSTN